MKMFVDKESGLTAEILRDSLRYDPDTGEFRWKMIDKHSWVKVGDIAGFSCPTNGYHLIKIGGRSYRAHRLAWLYMTGEWPNDRIDHRNTNKADNRWSNLREATHGQNMIHSAPYKKRLPLPKGVFKNGNKFGSQIRFEGKKVFLGNHATPELAHQRYIEEAEKLHGEFFRAA